MIYDFCELLLGIPEPTWHFENASNYFDCISQLYLLLIKKIANHLRKLKMIYFRFSEKTDKI